MKKLLLLLVGFVVAFATHADVTIRFFNTNNWSQVNIWAWTDAQEGGAWLAANGHSDQKDWPGPAMTSSSTNNCYQITFTNAPDHIIFSENGSDSNRKEVAYTEGVDYNADGAADDSHTYELWSNFRNNDIFKGYALNKSNNYSYTLTFQGDESGTKAGIHIDNNWKGAGNTSEYNGTTKTYNMTTNSGGDITFAKGLQGDVKFTLDIASHKLTLSGGSVEQGGSDYKTFYLVGKFNSWTNGDANYKFSTTDGKTYTLTTTSELINNVGSKESGFKITDGTWDGYVYGGKNGIAYALNTKYDLANECNINLDIPAGAKITFNFVDGGTSTLQIDKEIPTAIYMHFKEDLEEYRKDANTKPYCYLFNADNESVGSTEKVMTLESSRYSIWKADLTPEEFAKYNSVRFSFEKNSTYGGGSATYWSNKFADGTAVASFDKARWADFIYATASDKGKEYAVQTYLSYKDFADLDQKDIDNGGRRYIYIVGWGKDDNLPLKYFDASGNEQTMPGEITSALQVDQDGGCFYLPILPDGGSFKVSWISVADAIKNLPVGYSKTSSAREWATYDLGLIGVDKDYPYPNGITIDYNRNEGVNGKVHFIRNRSVRCMNYNQADWVLPDNTDNLPNVGRKRWIVVDTHYTEGEPDATCRTMTITSFDPHPSVKVTVENVVASADELDDESAKKMHVDCLHGAEANGHVYMKRVNYAVGKAEVTATKIDNVKNAKFSREYTLYVNGKKAGTTAADVTSMKIDYFPLALNKENSVSIRAKYTDSQTGLSFHSRVGNGEIDATVNFSEPLKKDLTGRYVFEREDEDGMQVYGIYVEGLNCEVENPKGYHVYSDFEFDLGGEAKFIDEQHYAHQVVNEIPYWIGWTPGDDWSTKMVNMQDNKEQKFAPVFIHDAVKVSDFKYLPKETPVKCTIYAVYPFMYNPDATLQVNSESAPQAAPAAKAGSYEGFKVFNTNVSKELNFKVTPSGAISGVENVAADVAADAEAEYYTIAGVRVIGEPAPGLYIRRQGEKVAKVVIR